MEYPKNAFHIYIAVYVLILDERKTLCQKQTVKRIALFYSPMPNIIQVFFLCVTLSLLLLLLLYLSVSLNCTLAPGAFSLYDPRIYYTQRLIINTFMKMLCIVTKEIE